LVGATNILLALSEGFLQKEQEIELSDLTTLFDFSDWVFVFMAVFGFEAVILGFGFVVSFDFAMIF
jgi:hypothetical protein